MKTWKEVQKMEASMERKQKVNLGVLKQATKPQTVAITNTDSIIRCRRRRRLLFYRAVRPL